MKQVSESPRVLLGAACKRKIQILGPGKQVSQSPRVLLLGDACQQSFLGGGARRGDESKPERPIVWLHCKGLAEKPRRKGRQNPHPVLYRPLLNFHYLPSPSPVIQQ
jgi:hypothetical protein